MFGNYRQGLILTHHALAQLALQGHHGSYVIVHHAAHGDAGPIGHDGRDHAGIHLDMDARMVALQLCKRTLQLLQFLGQPQLLGGIGERQQGLAPGENDAALGRLGSARIGQGTLAFLHACQPGFQQGQNDSALLAHGGLLLQQVAFALECGQLGLQVFERARRRVQGHGDAGTGGVEQADGLVGQLARRNVAVREGHGGAHRLVQNGHAMVSGKCRHQTAHHGNGGGLLRLHDLQHLKAPRQGRVFFNVLFVFGPGGGANRAQRSACQRRLE